MPRSRFKYNSLNRRLDVLVSGKLWLQVLIAIVIGVAVGALLGPDMNLVSRSLAELLGEWLALPGRLFLALIRMVIIPLVASSIIMGLTAAGDGADLKRIGMRFVLFVLATTMAAASLGGGLAWLSGAGKDIAAPATAPPAPSLKPDPATLDQAASPIEAISRDLPAMISNLIPQNISASILEQDMLAVVVFSIFIGIAVITADNRELTKPLVSLMGAVLEVCMTVIRTAMRFAPVAVFGLMAQTTALNGLNTLIDLALYCAVVIGGLALLLVLYLVIVGLFGGMTPWAFLRAVAPVQLLAFSTSSSAAVMPLTMKTAVEKLGVTPSLAGAVAPLAATVNMAGTALYQSAAIVFLANMSGVSLSFGEVAFIMITLTGASIGAPAAPGASIAVLSATATSFGIPLTGLALVLGVDRLLDMARTAVNVTGDLVACRLLSRGEETPPQASVKEAAPAATNQPETEIVNPV